MLHWKSSLRIVLCNITFNAGHTGIKIMLIPLDSPPHTIFTLNFNLITMIAIFAIIIIIIFILTTIFCKCLSLAFIMTEVSTWRVDKYLCCHHTNPSLWQPWRRYILSHKRFLSSQVYNHIMTTSGAIFCLIIDFCHFLACEQALLGALAAGREKEGELATMLLEFEFHLQFPCSSPLTELSNFHQSCAKVNDIITNVISTNQHYALTFSMQIFKFQRCSCKLSFLFPHRSVT